VVATTNTTYTSGPFTIYYSSEALPTLLVTQQDRVAWFTSSSHTPFLTAATITEAVTQIGGDYTFKTHTTDTCTKLEITDVGVSPPARNSVGKQHQNKFSVFYMHGVLCGNVAMEMSLQATEVTDDNGTSVHNHLLFHFSIADGSPYNQLQLVYGCEETEGFYGFGAQYSSLNMKGKVLPMFLSEQGVGRGLWPVTEILDIVSPGAGEKTAKILV
jgi:hypothetical protein